MSFLSVRALSKHYGPVTALDAVSLDVRQNSRTAIVGPSGSGKSTLLRIIAGFEPAASGTVQLNDEVLVDGPNAVPAHQRGIGIVSQDGALFPHLSIADNIAFGLHRRLPDRDKRVRDLMALIGLDHAMLDRRPHQLSGGQQQRVALARALARQPRLMLLDEPFSSLDTGLREQMRQAVTQILGTAGITSVLVTHDQAEALSFADQVALIRNGRLVQRGTPEEVYFRPADRQTALFLGEAVILPARLNNGTATTALGVFPTNQRASSGAAEILLRPEQITLCAPVAGQPQLEIEHAAFSGANWTLQLRLIDQPNHPPLHLRVSGIDMPPAGSRVGLAINGFAHVLGQDQVAA
ncbi:ABC transporter ATP-binding protein [Tianweitania sp. BSSL-BM11]|uniref:ABC transporter ATP-binding protein n=1 Tax=Tianweitania aestuarii TaxID=2814886 RepID=A0ABS5RZ32_9HYPH|nr:ABC transporter ATP-binding protein [Tianweitania aestuarii]MBS9721576.1 ABC transporter ATP-binding protein [Tianweitania aestuarii]